MRENEGRAVAVGGGDGLFNAVQESTLQEPCVIYLKNAGQSTTINAAIRSAQEAGLIRTYRLTSAGTERWLGTMDGPLARGEYEAQTGRDNI
jgi:hypothetical protein